MDASNGMARLTTNLKGIKVMNTITVKEITKQQEALLINSLAEGLAKQLKAENVTSSYDGLNWESGSVNVEWVATDEFQNDDGLIESKVDLSVNVLFDFTPVEGFVPTQSILVGIMTYNGCFESKTTGELEWLESGRGINEGYILNYGYHSCNFVWGLSKNMGDNYTESEEEGITYDKDDEISLAVINKAWEMLDPIVKSKYLQALFDTACKKELER